MTAESSPRRLYGPPTRGGIERNPGGGNILFGGSNPGGDQEFGASAINSRASNGNRPSFNYGPPRVGSSFLGQNGRIELNGGLGGSTSGGDLGFGASSISNRKAYGDTPSTNYGTPGAGSGFQGFNGGNGFNGGFGGSTRGDLGFGASSTNNRRGGNRNRGSNGYGSYGLDPELAELADSLPGGGVPGEDFPVLSEVPETGFQCEDQALTGYYADPEAQCQAFHICQIRESGLVQQDSFLCPNGTIFNQQYFVCDWWYNFDCDTAEDFYTRNEQIGMVENNGNGGRFPGAGGFGGGNGLVGAASNNQNGFFGGNNVNGYSGNSGLAASDSSQSGNRFNGGNSQSRSSNGRFGGSGNGGQRGYVY